MIASGKRHGVQRSRRRLNIRNPFYSTNTLQPAGYWTYRSPIISSGVTSLEQRAKQAAQEKWRQLQNAGIVGDDEDGPLDLTNFSEAIVMPGGVGNVDQFEAARSAANKIQRHNAGILSTKEYNLRKLQKILNAKKKREAQANLIEYLAEADEMDQVPEEYREEVEKWYRAGLEKDMINEETGTLNENAAVFQGEKGKALLQQLKDEGLAKLLVRRMGVRRVTAAKRKIRQEKEQRERERQDRIAAVLRQVNEENRRARGDDMKSSMSGNGWRAPFIYELVRPHHALSDDLQQTPEDIIKQHKDELEQRQELYRDQQTERRGVKPPNAMVRRAMPDLAEPANTPLPTMRETMFMVTPHSFVFPHKRFVFSPAKQ